MYRISRPHSALAGQTSAELARSLGTELSRLACPVKDGPKQPLRHRDRSHPQRRSYLRLVNLEIIRAE